MVADAVFCSAVLLRLALFCAVNSDADIRPTNLPPESHALLWSLVENKFDISTSLSSNEHINYTATLRIIILVTP